MPKTSRTIRIDEETYQALQNLAEPLQDTPNTVLRRLLALDQTPLLWKGKTYKRLMDLWREGLRDHGIRPGT